MNTSLKTVNSAAIEHGSGGATLLDTSPEIDATPSLPSLRQLPQTDTRRNGRAGARAGAEGVGQLAPRLHCAVRGGCRTLGCPWCCVLIAPLLPRCHRRTLQFEVAGVTVHVVQDPELTRQETGSYLWEEASEHLINFVLKEFGGDVKGRRFVDLGCGCGSVGNALALLGGDVTLTDVSELMSNVQANIDANTAEIAEAGGRATFIALDWTDANREKILRDAGPFDMVVGSELMYAAVLLGDTHAPLISTIQAAMAASAQSDPAVNCVGMLAGEYHFVSAMHGHR